MRRSALCRYQFLVRHELEAADRALTAGRVGMAIQNAVLVERDTGTRKDQL
jgi:hypothetical protein